MEEEEPPKADENCVLEDRRPGPTVTKASHPECIIAEVQNASRTLTDENKMYAEQNQEPIQASTVWDTAVQELQAVERE
jgi:hypothetical protein